LRQPRIAAHRTFGAGTAHDLVLVASGLSGHLAQATSIPELRRTRRVALLVPPYLRRRKLTVRAFGTEGQHCSVGLFLHNKNSHNLSSISVSVKSPLQNFPRLAEAVREPKPTARPDVIKASEGHVPHHVTRRQVSSPLMNLAKHSKDLLVSGLLEQHGCRRERAGHLGVFIFWTERVTKIKNKCDSETGLLPH
jgi:hypothetical protein